MDHKPNSALERPTFDRFHNETVLCLLEQMAYREKVDHFGIFDSSRSSKKTVKRALISDFDSCDTAPRAKKSNGEAAPNTSERPKKTFKCFYCPKKLFTVVDRLKHVRVDHHMKPQISDDCKKAPTLNTSESVKKAFKCFYCPKKLSTIVLRLKHVRADHHMKPLNSDAHKKVLSPNTRESPKKAFKCFYCPKKLSTVVERLKHVRVDHHMKPRISDDHKMASAPNRCETQKKAPNTSETL